MNIEQRKELLKLTLKKVARRWFPNASNEEIEHWIVVMYGSKIREITKGASFVQCTTSRPLDKYLRYACEEATIDPETLPAKETMVCDFVDGVAGIKNAEGVFDPLEKHSPLAA